MPWSWAEISGELFEGNQTLNESKPLLASFNFVELHLGHAWVRDEHRLSSIFTVVKGKSQAVGQNLLSGQLWAERVEAMAQQLRASEGSSGVNEVLARIRARERTSARSELFSAYLARPEDQSAKVEFGVDAMVDTRKVNLDFRIRKDSQEWINAEVVHLASSKKQKEASDLLQQLKLDVEAVVPLEASVEIMLRRETRDSLELEEIVNSVRVAVAQRAEAPIELPDLALVIPRYQTSSVFAVEDHGEPTVSRLGVVSFGAGGDHGNVAIRLKFSDKRAEKILKEKSKQIPENSPALTFVDGTGSSASFSEWREVLLSRFQRKLHTRVGAVVMYLNPIIGGLLMWGVVNPCAASPLPDWLLGRLRSWSVNGTILIED